MGSMIPAVMWMKKTMIFTDKLQPFKIKFWVVLRKSLEFIIFQIINMNTWFGLPQQWVISADLTFLF